MPQLLWKAYIDFEVEEGERARARALYERLVVASGHWKVWVAYATFEAQSIQLPRDEREEDEDEDEDEEREVKMVEGDLELARQVFQRGYKDLKSKGLKNEVQIFSSVILAFANGLHFPASGTVASLEELRGRTRYARGCRARRGHDAHPGQTTLCGRGDRTTCRRYALFLVSPLHGTDSLSS